MLYEDEIFAALEMQAKSVKLMKITAIVADYTGQIVTPELQLNIEEDLSKMSNVIKINGFYQLIGSKERRMKLKCNRSERTVVHHTAIAANINSSISCMLQLKPTAAVPKHHRRPTVQSNTTATVCPKSVRRFDSIAKIKLPENNTNIKLKTLTSSTSLTPNSIRSPGKHHSRKSSSLRQTNSSTDTSEVIYLQPHQQKHGKKCCKRGDQLRNDKAASQTNTADGSNNSNGNSRKTSAPLTATTDDGNNNRTTETPIKIQNSLWYRFHNLGRKIFGRFNSARHGSKTAHLSTLKSCLKSKSKYGPDPLADIMQQTIIRLRQNETLDNYSESNAADQNFSCTI